MTSHEDALYHRLLEAPGPYNMNNWETQDGYYVTACRISENDVPALINLVRKWNDKDWPSDADLDFADPDEFEMLPVTAWRTLGDLKAEAAVEPLIDILGALDDEFDDWATDELPHVFGKIGEASFEPLTRIAMNQAKPQFVRSIAARGLEYLAKYHVGTRDRVVTWLTNAMANATSDQIEFNTSLLVALVELNVVQAAEQIERAFAGNLLDISVMGDWESVRHRLGVEGMGLTMPQTQYKSIPQDQIEMGIGVFSQQPIFSDGEIDSEAEYAYYRRAFHEFGRSMEGRLAIQRYEGLEWIESLLDFGIHHLGESVDEMTRESVNEFLFDYIPRKVSTESSQAANIIGEILAFWEYLDRVFQLPAARSILDLLKTKDLVAQLKAELSDSSNFGMAKSIFMMGKDAGYDMTSQADLTAFMTSYNESLQPEVTPQSQIIRTQRVGRNEPCPCGSGKKFKKCCGQLQ